METKFTSGPWPVERTGDGKRYIVGKGLVDGPNGYDVAEVYSDDCDPEEAAANAHVIGAAPNMYGALAECATTFADYAEIHRRKLADALPVDRPAILRKVESNRKMSDLCMAALAKARGESA